MCQTVSRREVEQEAQVPGLEQKTEQASGGGGGGMMDRLRGFRSRVKSWADGSSKPHEGVAAEPPMGSAYNAPSPATGGSVEVPDTLGKEQTEFLMALPPELREEALLQLRSEASERRETTVSRTRS